MEFYAWLMVIVFSCCCFFYYLTLILSTLGENRYNDSQSNVWYVPIVYFYNPHETKNKKKHTIDTHAEKTLKL